MEGKHRNIQDLEDELATLRQQVADLEGRMGASIKAETALMESEQKFKLLYDRAPLAYQSLDQNGDFVAVNPAWLEALGYTEEEVIGRNFADFLPPDWADHFRENFPRFKAVGEILGVEFEMVKKDGSKMLVSFNGKIGVDSQGRFKQTHCVFQNITEKRLVEEALQNSEKRYRRLFESAKDGILILDADTGRVVDVNPFLLRLLGYSYDELFGKHIWEIGVFKDTAESREAFKILQDSEYIRYEDLPLQTFDGRRIDVEFVSNVYLVDRAKVIQCNIRDITERKRAERELREITSRLNLATASAKAGVWDWNLQENDMVWDDQMFELYGLTRENFPGAIQAWEQALHPDDSLRAIEEFRAAINGQRHLDTKFRVLRPDGTVVHIKADGHVLRDGDGKPLRMIGLNIDITAREQVEEKLRESEERLDIALSSAHMGVWSREIAEDVRCFDDRVCLLLGIDPATFTGAAEEFFRRVHPDDREPLTAAMARTLSHGAFYEVEYRVIWPDGSLHYINSRGRLIRDMAGRPLRVYGIDWDITERKSAEETREKLQAQLSQARKMESVGRLAGGVAHDFNNMLGVILGHVEMAMEQVDSTQPLHADLQEIQKAAERSADLTRQLLAFARKQTVAPKILDLNETVEGMLKMLRRLIGEDMDLAWLPDNNLWPVKVDPTQIDQILANLCVNARDAIDGNGKITIETENIVFDRAYCADHAGTVAGEYVLLAVSDNGCGMDEETRGRLFEPFFTTKGVGEGTGLGLATVYGIVRQNSGFVNVYSEPSQGTTFKIYLPRHAAKAEQTSKAGATKPTIRRGDETILLVEDEPAILKMATKMLERQGYTVLQAGTPGEAIRLAKAHPGQIDLLMSDVVMPEMNAKELYANLNALRPGLESLFMSGYTANVIAHHGVLEEGVHFLQKPFSNAAMAEKVRHILDKKIK
ncbi:MAG: PAS domain S-box protein [Syntrophobacteraceae bacterium]|nr:PAS domain S-box protein [Syntrophobacteraceae bacterium]